MERLDQYLVEHELAVSRTKAAELIASGHVTVNGRLVHKPAFKVAEHASVSVELPEKDYVSRAGHKLAGALATFSQIQVDGKECLDAGASTGGFTQVLLEAGAHRVHAVDVGHGQLVDQIRHDQRVHVYERQNIRTIHEVLPAASIDLVVSDLSFISLTLVLHPVATVTADGGDLILMVKPQFEVGRDQLGKSGVVQDPQLRRKAVEKVVQAGIHEGLELRGIGRSQLTGQDGNVEFFCWFTKNSDATNTATEVNELLDSTDFQ